MSEAVLCIEDTGMGIAPEDLPRIFERGYTGYNGRTDKRASGLGLYLCRRICNNLGAEIWASSPSWRGDDYLYKSGSVCSEGGIAAACMRYAV